MSYFIVSDSHGRDSEAMLLQLLEQGRPIDEVIYCDMGSVEFDCVHEMSDRIGALLKERGIKHTILHPKEDFLYCMFEKPIGHHGTGHKGMSWCGANCRWGTALKLDTIDRYLKSLGRDDIVEYIGIAANESRRSLHTGGNRYSGKHVVKKYPLIEAGFTEDMCLKYCNDRGYDWIENGHRLYGEGLFNHLSCICCRNKSIMELRNLYLYLPDKFAVLEDMQRQTGIPFMRDGRTIADMKKLFEEEKRQLTLWDI